MFNSHRHIKSLLYFKVVTSPSPKHFPFSFLFSTNTSNYPTSFPGSYLINNLGFSPQSASKLCSTYHLRFETSENPDSVLTFFTNHGFSHTQLHNMIRKAPWLLSCDPYKRVLPKFQFFHSKGASTSDIVNLVSKRPIVLRSSMEKQIVPAYELVYKFLKSDKDTIALLNRNPDLFGTASLAHIITMLIENGVTESNIARAGVFGFSLEKRIIPRAGVVQYLLENGLRKKNASLTTPFHMSEKMFLDKFVSGFKEESSYLLNMYEEKLNHAYTQDKTGMS